MFTLSIKFKLCLYFGFLLICTNHVKSYQVETEEDALAYLLNYGYVESKNMPRGFTFQDCDEKLKEFQKMAHIPVTGELDDATMKAMNMPRCGCPDFMKITFREDSDTSDNAIIPINDEETNHHHHHHHHHSHSNQWPYSRHNNRFHHHHHRRINQTNSRSHIRAKRYTISDLKWKSKVVTYNIRKYPSRRDFKVSRREVEDAIHKAFNIWEEHIDLQFVYQSNNVEADIIIQFLSGDHNDGCPFDGPGNSLAHAFFPGTGIGGDIHFEEEENWTLGTYNGVDILHVAVHELGHSLGLGHNHNELGSIMFPMYKGYSPNLQLHSDDIQGAQALYGRKNSRNPTPKPTIRTTTTRPTSTRRTTRKTLTNATTTTPTPFYPNYELCDGKAVDAIVNLFEEAVLVFKGENVFEIGRNGEGILSGWPKNIGKYFKGLERDLDCAMTRTNGKTYFFKGSKYWRFTGNKMDRGYPRSISEYFPGIPNDLDAAFEWDEEFVFVKGTNFWRFNTRKRPQVERYFPFPISHWGLRKRLDAAFTDWKGDIYFVQGLYYWKFDKVGHSVVHDSHYPGLVTEDWFGCKEP